MAARFNGKINIDIRDSESDWTPFEPPKAPEGGPNVRLVAVDVSGEPYMDLEREAAMMLARE